METIPFAEERNAAFAKLAERAAQANMTPAERAAYEESRKNIRDYYNAIDTAANDARAEGRAEGREEGRVESVKMFVANMYAQGFAISIICQCTGLSEDEVIKILQTLS